MSINVAAGQICKVCHNAGEFRQGRNTCRKCESVQRAVRRSYNWDQELEYKRAWRIKNRDLVKLYHKVDCANKRSEDRITVEDVKFIFERDNGRCVICQSNRLIELDHIIPLAEGGPNVRENLQLLCRRHNAVKGGTVIDEERAGTEYEGW